MNRTEQNRTEVYLNFPKGINAIRIYTHNIIQCTNMAVDGVVLKCSRICNKPEVYKSHILNRMILYLRNKETQQTLRIIVNIQYDASF